MGQRDRNPDGAVSDEIAIRERTGRGSAEPDTRRVDDRLAGDVLRSLPVGVVVTDAVGRQVMANAAAQGLAADDPMVETSRRRLDIAGEIFTLTTRVDVGHHKRLAEELFDRAYLDELTGLPNRALCERSALQLIESLAPDERFALVFIDLDNFKHINDFYSHAAGDAVLVKVAERIGGLLRPSDMLARLGGDEFVLLMTPVADATALRARLEAMAARLREPVFVEGYEVFVSASMGASLFPDHGTTYDVLRRSADSAMYRIKSGVKGGVAMFDESMREAATGRMAIEQRFRLAVRDRRFCCAYQPKVDIRTQEVVGVEVLLRWRDEQGAIRAPGAFVALAIELGLINQITHMMLGEVMASLDLLDATYGPGISISINIAAKQAEDLAFMTSFVDALAATGCADRFMLELTEEAFFAKSRFQANVLPQLRAIGTKVSIDDFGAGYSALSALADIEADEIKIDRAFITDIHKRPRNQIVLKGIESLGRALGMTIIAEGIETFEELVWLQASTSIHHAQGYYFAKPVVLPDARPIALDVVSRPRAIGRHAAPSRGPVLRAG